MQYQLDVTAYLCPLPLLYTKNALKQLKQGDKLTVIANQSISLVEFEQLCERFQVNISHIEITEKRHKFEIG